MILQKTKKINSKNEIIKKLNEVNVIGFTCPYCKNKEFVYYGSYERYLVIEEKGEIEEIKVKIKRVQCKNCKKTHAVIPDFIIPYKICEFKIVNKVIYLKINNIKNNKEIESEYKVSRQLIRKWIKEFNRIRSKVEILVKDIKKVLEIEAINYYKMYKEIYLMTRENFYGYTST